MAYDDDSSRFNFKDFENILANYYSLPENITFGRLRSAVQALSTLSNGEQLTVHQVEAVLIEHKVSNLPIETVVGLLDAIAPYSGKDDVASRLTIRDLERALSRSRVE